MQKIFCHEVSWSQTMNVQLKKKTPICQHEVKLINGHKDNMRQHEVKFFCWRRRGGLRILMTQCPTSASCDTSCIIHIHFWWWFLCLFIFSPFTPWLQNLYLQLWAESPSKLVWNRHVFSTKFFNFDLTRCLEKNHIQLVSDKMLHTPDTKIKADRFWYEQNWVKKHNL